MAGALAEQTGKPWPGPAATASDAGRAVGGAGPKGEAIAQAALRLFLRDGYERTSVDAIAAEILIPDSVVTRLLGGSSPEPAHLRHLYAASSASEEVCAIALASRIPVRGAVLLIRRDTATVTFAAGSGYPSLRIPRDLLVPPGHPLRDLGTRQQWTGLTTPDLRLALTDLPTKAAGSRIPDEPFLRAHAEAGPRRTTAVLMDNASPGGPEDDLFRRARKSPPDAARVPEPIACPACGQASARSSYPCEECGAPPCPACGRCRCP